MASVSALQIPSPRVGSGAERAAAVRAVLDGRRQVRHVLQAIVDVRDGRVVGYEALARFSPRVTTPPTAWFAAANRLRRSAELEAGPVVRGLDLLPELPKHCFLALNVSPALLANPVVLASFATQHDLSRVVVELTEHVEFGTGVELTQSLQDLRARGARLALDDVGAGWAGLRQVVELRPDIVKLDHSLVEGADRDEVKLALADMMLRLCSRLGAQLLVEGVENLDELDTFARLGVPLAQGWVFGRPGLAPLPIDDDLSVRLKFLAGLLRHSDKVASLVDVTVDRQPAGTALPDSVDGAVLVHVDAHGRPTTVHLHEDGEWHSAPAMAVVASTEIGAALLQAMTRPGLSRFPPLACVDRAGRHVGVIPIDALARAAARRDDAETIELPR